MIITLKPYQQEALDELLHETEKIFRKNLKNQVIVFQSPTGSGKTVMMAEYMYALMAENRPDANICFLWVTVGKGELHLQSADALTRYINGKAKVCLYENEYANGTSAIENRTIAVVNWEKLRSKDKATGDWKNKLMREGETYNFTEIAQQTRNAGRKLVLVIDESHIGMTAERTQELRDMIAADLTIEVSATPKSVLGSKTVVVQSSDVIDEGVIKKDIYINADLGKINFADATSSETAVLEAAYAKRLELKALYENLGKNINPLVLVQLPNSEAGSSKKEAVEAFLKTKNITKHNEKLAVWLDGDKSDIIKEIAEKDNGIEFLVFKQAIDTGWDCPRAAVLVKFRNIKSETFEIQTVGRILRMPEQQHYIHDELNIGYVYTDIEDVAVKTDEYSPNILKTARSKRDEARYAPIALHSYYKNRVDYGDITRTIRPVLEKIICEYFGISVKTPNNMINIAENAAKMQAKGFDTTLLAYQANIIKDGSIKVAQLHDPAQPYTVKGRIAFNLSDGDLLAKFETNLKQHFGKYAPKRSMSSVKAAFYEWFKTYLGIQGSDQGLMQIQNTYLKPQNAEILNTLLAKAVAAYEPVKIAENAKKLKEEWYDWEVNAADMHNSDLEKTSVQPLSIMQPCYLLEKRSAPEKTFEQFLETKTNSVQWWYKNGVSKKNYFAIKYEKQGYPYAFYPDYIVQFTDGRIGIFDTKDGNTAENAGERAEALQAYIAAESEKGKNIFGGIIIIENNTLRINQKGEYMFNSKKLNSDWLFLNDVF